ncbi:hypothetical protein IU485_16150 [Nocardia cyriacigeorgica]|uniref:hypothetical protein n=1 Tax=Nocardia cyriacigeorgica TaxID=135487 RepID=UPI001895FCD7|nr:hypothetical protein [Nocardia cyriacigeorgica]MBF6082897.1 hypothetical protein [Nocardia cyriacigeorgica]
MTITICYLVVAALVAVTGWLVASVAVHETLQHRTRRHQRRRSDRRVAPVRKAAAARRNREAYRHIPEGA